MAYFPQQIGDLHGSRETWKQSMNSPYNKKYSCTFTDSFRILGRHLNLDRKRGVCTNESKAILSRGKGISRDILDPRLRSPRHGPAGVFQGHAATGRAE